MPLAYDEESINVPVVPCPPPERLGLFEDVPEETVEEDVSEEDSDEVSIVLDEGSSSEACEGLLPCDCVSELEETADETDEVFDEAAELDVFEDVESLEVEDEADEEAAFPFSPVAETVIDAAAINTIHIITATTDK